MCFGSSCYFWIIPDFFLLIYERRQNNKRGELHGVEGKEWSNLQGAEQISKFHIISDDIFVSLSLYLMLRKQKLWISSWILYLSSSHLPLLLILFFFLKFPLLSLCLSFQVSLLCFLFLLLHIVIINNTWLSFSTYYLPETAILNMHYIFKSVYKNATYRTTYFLF